MYLSKSDIYQFVKTQIQRDITVHKSLEIRELIKQEIIDGKLTEGSRLMPVRQLAQFYGISYLTMNHVLEQLEQENLIVRVHGKGVFVSSAPQRSPREIRRVLTLYHGRDAIVPLFLSQLQDFCNTSNAELFFLEISDLPPEKRMEKLRAFLSQPADVLIVDGSYDLPFREIDKYRTNFRKTIFFNRYESSFELSNSAKVLFDYFEAGKISGEALLANNRKKLLYIAPDSSVRCKFPPFGPEETYHCRMRHGLMAALSGSGVRLENLITTPKKILTDLDEMLKRYQPDGIFVFHDDYAIKIYHWLNSHKLTPGKQMDVIGCFNTEIAKTWLTPGLSSIRFDSKRVMTALDEYIGGTEKNFKVMIPPELVIRGSMKQLPSKKEVDVPDFVTG